MTFSATIDDEMSIKKEMSTKISLKFDKIDNEKNDEIIFAIKTKANLTSIKKYLNDDQWNTNLKIMKKRQRRSIEDFQLFKARFVIEKIFASIKTFVLFINIVFINFLFDERRFELLSNEFESEKFKSSVTNNFTMTHLIHAENLVKDFVNLIKILKKNWKQQRSTISS